MENEQLERLSYLAAYRIMTDDLTHPDLACPGSRRSRTLDDIANIIKSVAAAYKDTCSCQELRQN